MEPLDKLPYSPVMARGGSVVHATSLKNPVRTACGRLFRGWILARRIATCRQCKLAIFKDCRAGKRASK